MSPVGSPSAAEVVIDAVAVYRLTRLLQRDTVPPVAEIREWLMEHYSDRRWAELLDCPWCASVWIAALVALARWRFPRAWPVLARVLAGSAVTGLLGQLDQ